MNVEDIVDILAIDLLGVIPDDEAIVISTNKGEPVVAEDRPLAAKAYRNICDRITGKEVEFLDLEDHEGKFSKILKLLFNR